jgi:Rieske Fe-S protein
MTGWGCRKKEDLVPYTHVDFNIYLSDPQFYELQSVGNYVVVTGGVEGIIIYRKSVSEFVALERNCTYNPSDGCAVSPDTSGLILHCSCCGSEFLIMDGSVNHDPAKRPLVLYNTSYDGLNTVRVYN